MGKLSKGGTFVLAWLRISCAWCRVIDRWSYVCISLVGLIIVSKTVKQGEDSGHLIFHCAFTI